jgi:predicted nucleotidyltransferase
MKSAEEDIQIRAEKIGIKMAVLFGSRVNGTATDTSDYDIAVLTDSDHSIYRSDLHYYATVLEFLEKELGIPADELDISGINEANPLLRYGIFSNGKLLFGDRDEFDGQHARAFREYIDAKPLFDLERMMLKKQNERLAKLLV